MLSILFASTNIAELPAIDLPTRLARLKVEKEELLERSSLQQDEDVAYKALNELERTEREAIELKKTHNLTLEEVKRKYIHNLQALCDALHGGSVMLSGAPLPVPGTRGIVLAIQRNIQSIESQNRIDEVKRLGSEVRIDQGGEPYVISLDSIAINEYGAYIFSAEKERH